MYAVFAFSLKTKKINSIVDILGGIAIVLLSLIAE
jgi:hypothetical protein